MKRDLRDEDLDCNHEMEDMEDFTGRCMFDKICPFRSTLSPMNYFVVLFLSFVSGYPEVWM